MRVMFTLLFLLSVSLVSCATDREDKILFLCDRGETVLLTGDSSNGCPIYQPQSELITVPDGATWADVEWAVAKKRAERPSPAQVRSEKVRTDRCAQPDLVLEWDITVGKDTPEDVKKWQRLSRIEPVANLNLCEEYRTKQVYPRF